MNGFEHGMQNAKKHLENNPNADKQALMLYHLDMANSFAEMYGSATFMSEYHFGMAEGLKD